MSEPRLPDLVRSFERHLRAENKSDRTVETYLEAVRLLEAFLAGPASGWPKPTGHTLRRFRRPTCPLEAGDRRQPLSLAQGVLRLAGGRGRDRGRPDGQDEAAGHPRAAGPCP